MRRLGVLVLSLGACLLAAGPLRAHGVLERSEPRSGATLKTTPSHVRLYFTGAIEPAYSRVHVLDAAGRRVDLGDSTVDPANRTQLRVSLPALSAGRYRVAWRVLSVDSHVTEGDFSFRLAP